MSVLVNKDTRLVVQGITGSAGSFHTTQCMDYGTNVVAGVTPGKGGQKFQDSVPVFDTVQEAVDKEGANVAAIYVPPHLRPILFWKRSMRKFLLSLQLPREFLFVIWQKLKLAWQLPVPA